MTYRDLSGNERRFFGPSDDPPEYPEAPENVLTQEGTEALLNEFDLYSVVSRFDPNVAEILDDEGDLLFGVPIGIAPNCLRSIVTYGQRQRKYGEAAGKRGIQASLRALLDVPANPPEPE